MMHSCTGFVINVLLNNTTGQIKPMIIALFCNQFPAKPHTLPADFAKLHHPYIIDIDTITIFSVSSFVRALYLARTEWVQSASNSCVNAVNPMRANCPLISG